MTKILTREKIRRMVNVTGTGVGGGGSFDAGQINEILGSYLTIENARQQFVSIEFFKRLFQAHGVDDNNDPTDVDPNDTETTITDIEAMFGFWTEQYLSALGNGGGGGTGGATALTDLVDVALSNPTNGQALVYNATTGKWTNQTIGGGGTDMATVWSNLAAATNEQINASHLANALSGYAQRSTLADYLPIAGGTVTGNLSVGGTLAVTGAATFSNSVTAGSFIKSGGTSSQFLKADGSVDNNTYATQTWVGENYISIAFFSRLFKAYNGTTLVSPNNTTATIDNIKAMFGFWTEQYLSALGNGGGGGTGGSTALSDLVDVAIASPTNGQALVYNATTGKWTNQTISGGGADMATVWSALAASTNEQINASHLSSVLSAYLPISGGTLTGELITASPITINGYGGRTFGITPTNAGHNGDNVDVGWNWTDKDGAGAFFRSSDANSQPGSFGFYARNSSGTTCQLIGTPAGSLTWGGNELLTSADVGNFVTLDTAQTITGAKTFSSTITLSNASASYTISAKDANSAGRDFLKIVYTMNSDTGVQTASMTLNSYGNLTTAFAPANTEGYQRLRLGSSNKLNAANNMYGSIRLYGRRDSSNPSGTVYYGDINPDVLSANRTWTLPNKSGTIALADDFGDLFTALTSTNATNLSVTIGGTTKTLTDVYAYQAKNVRPFSMAAGDDYDTLSNYTLTRGCFVAMNYNSLTTNDVTLDDLGTYDTLVSFGYNQRTIQFKGNAYGTMRLKYRRVYQPSTGVYAFSPWKELAFADGNIATATALATARTLWGQSFDGSANVSGNMTDVGSFKQSGAINMQGSTANYCQGIRLHPVNGTSSIFFGCDVDSGMTAGMFGITHNTTGLRIRGQASTTSTSLVDYLTVAYGGNVGIGTSSPSYLLHVNGQAAAQTFRSTVETGTAPLVVASSTLVTNLNADRLDGYHASDFAMAADVTTLQGYFDSSGAAKKAVQLKTSRTLWGQSFDGTGDVTGAMTSVGSITLTNNSRISNATGSSGSLYIGRSDDAGWVKMSDMCSRQGDSYWKIKSNGDATFGNVFSNGDVSGMSDARKKTVIEHLTLDVRRIAEMPIVRFLWKDRSDNSLQVGTLAQSWLPLLPEIVTHSNDDVYGVKYGVGAMCIGVSNSREIVGLINQVVDLNHRMELLEKGNRELMNENRDLRDELEKIKKYMYGA